MMGVCRLDAVGGMECMAGVGGTDGCVGGVGILGVGGFVSRYDGWCGYALYGGFSASGDDTLGAAAPQTELSCSPRRVLPLRPDSVDRLTERSPGCIGSGMGGPERGVCTPGIGISRVLTPFDALDDIEVVRVRSSSKLRDEPCGSMGCEGIRGEAYTDGRPLRMLGSREGGWEMERDGPRSEGEERTETLSSGELSGSSSSTRCPLSL